MVNEHVQSLDEEFQVLQKDDPDLTFAEFYAAQVLKQIDAGEPHATLGPKLKKGDFWEVGKRRFRDYHRFFKISSSMKVIDYGCGTLRLGAHFIQFLEPKHYYGMEVVTDYLAMGRELIGDLDKTKKPKLGLIGDQENYDAGIAFDADLVLSSAVAFHVHPDELGTYLDSMKAFAHKPGAIVAFDAMIADEEVRYGHRGWIRPLEVYTDGMDGFELVAQHRPKEQQRGNTPYVAALLDFRRKS